MGVVLKTGRVGNMMGMSRGLAFLSGSILCISLVAFADAQQESAGQTGEASKQVSQGLSKRDYVRTRMQWAKNNPNWNPTTEELEKRFDELDKDGDGFLSEEEQAAEKARGLSKREYVRTRLDWSRSNPNWNPTVEELEARFDAADKDGDGFLSEEEQAAERANRRR